MTEEQIVPEITLATALLRQMNIAPRKSPVRFLYGTGGVGLDGQKYLNDRAAIQQILDEFKRHGHNEIDTARVYGSSTTESILSELRCEEQGFLIHTKINPFFPFALNTTNLTKSLAQSLSALQTTKVHVLYLHAPERATPLEETLSAVNEVYKQGHFDEFGLSNYPANEIAQIVQICTERGYVRPTVYQGLYNLLVRSCEKDLFPVLRRYGIKFLAYSPVASFLVPEMNKDVSVPHYGRFDPATPVGRFYRAMFFKESYFKALDSLKEAGKQYNLTITEIAIRWLVHHSQISARYNDGVVLGGNNLQHVKQNLEYAERPPLPEDIVKLAQDVWELIKADAPPYCR